MASLRLSSKAGSAERSAVFPASGCGLVQRLQRLANVGLAFRVDVKVLAEFVHQRGEIL